MPHDGTPPAPRPGAPVRSRARGRPTSHHVIAVLLGLAALVGPAVSGIVSGLLPSPTAEPPPGPTTALASGAATAGDPGGTGATGAARATRSAGSSVPKGPLTLVGLGDSVPSAETCGCSGYVEQTGSRLGQLTHRSWVVHNDANGGWTTADVAGDLSSSPTRDHLASADLVLVEVGANDFNLDRVEDSSCFPAAGSACWSSTVAGLRDGLTQIIQAVRSIDHRPDLRIALLGYWNITVDGSVGRALGESYVLGSDALTRLVNDTIQQVATTTGSVYVDAYSPLKGPTGTRDPTADLLLDGDHPNADGHALLAGAVVDQLRATGAVPAWTTP